MIAYWFDSYSCYLLSVAQSDLFLQHPPCWRWRPTRFLPRWELLDLGNQLVKIPIDQKDHQ